MTFRYEQVERGISEALRLKCIALGLLPDRRIYLPNNFAGYTAAKQTIRNGGGKVIEVYGIGSVEARDTKKYNSIYIDGDDSVPGSIGMFGTKTFVERVDGITGKTVYDVYLNQTGTVTLEYQISYMTDDADYDRIIKEIIFDVLKVRGFLLGINDDGTTMTRGFNTSYRTVIDKSGKDYIEKSFRYDVPDIAIEAPVFLYTTSQATDIAVNTDPADNAEQAAEEIQ